MIGRLLWNDVKHHKLLTATTIFFMAASSMFFALTAVLFTGLLGSVNGLMEQAKTPDYLQMHAGEIDEEKIAFFAETQEAVTDWQICPFLNLENSRLFLGANNLADNTQDNGLCVQGEKFDYLLDMNNVCPTVSEGEVYVPACYRSMYDLDIGDQMQIGGEALEIAGFLRDSQMNSMMASSKRFLVCKADYERLKHSGTEEYLIEFLLREDADTDSFSAAYGAAGLYDNGPAITKPLIRMMNALSDGIMILVIFLAGIVVLAISLLCIRFITAIGMERDRKEAGLLKAVGIGNDRILFLYFAKYLLLSVGGVFIGFVAAEILKRPLSVRLKELYGATGNELLSTVIALLACVLVQTVILLFIRRRIKKLEKMTTLEALFSAKTPDKKAENRQYVLIGLVAAACAVLALIPQNLYSTMSSPEFVTYMGIGDARIRMDVRQSDHIRDTTEQLEKRLRDDAAVKKYTVLQTISCPAYLSDGSVVKLLVEMGDHSVFPVSYAEGGPSVRENEIALSSLLAQDLGLSVGDTLELETAVGRRSVVVCGIYSDITNGGKTAKMWGSEFTESADTPIMWCILYVSLQDDTLSEAWITSYSLDGVDIVDIADYVQGTYGPTLEQISLSKAVSMASAILIVSVVLILFMRLLVEMKRYQISLQKALGFAGSSIQKQYFFKGFLPVIVGVMAGVAVSNTLGEIICGRILGSLGAVGFHFLIDWQQVLLMLLLLIMAVVCSIWLGIGEIQKIKAYECCMRKE